MENLLGVPGFLIVDLQKICNVFYFQQNQKRYHGNDFIKNQLFSLKKQKFCYTINGSVFRGV